jgi:hypothetical protein
VDDGEVAGGQVAGCQEKGEGMMNADNNTPVSPLELPPATPRFAYEKRVFFDAQGRQVHEHIPALFDLPADFPRFAGVLRVTAQTPRGPVQRDVEFGLPVATLQAAYAAFDAEAEKTMQQMKAALVRQQLMQPPARMDIPWRRNLNGR